MKFTIVAALVALATAAQALPVKTPANYSPIIKTGSHCQTTCTGFGNTRTCNTYCY